MITDGAVYKYSPLEDLCQSSNCDGAYKNTIHILCSWHLINQGMKCYIPSGQFSVDALAHLELISKWLHLCTSSIKNDAESEVSNRILRSWLTSKEVCGIDGSMNPMESGMLGKAMAMTDEDFITKPVWPLLNKIRYSRRKSIGSFGLKTLSIVKSESGFISASRMKSRQPKELMHYVQPCTNKYIITIKQETKKL